MNNSARYTEELKGRTVASVEHKFYGDSTIHFTDGTCVRLCPSGSPSTIFMTLTRDVKPLMARLFKV